ncbi:MAG: hypothetical protein WC352_00300 [Candidatus Omnitrophota bacterium]
MPKMIVRIAVALGIFSLSLGTGVRAAEEPAKTGGFGISISPSIIRLAGKPGESQAAEVRVWNKSAQPMQVFVEVNDLGNRVDEEGKLARVFLAPGTLPYSCAKWILLNESECVIRPGEYKDVKFLIATPQDSSGGSTAVVFFRGSTVQNAEANSGTAESPATSVEIQPRLGVLVFLDVTGTVQRTGNLQDFQVTPPAEGEPMKIQYVFENAGNADILVEGSFFILDQNQALVAKENLNALRTFPGDRGASETFWDSTLAPGRYHLVASFELGPETTEVIVRETDFTVA